MRFGHIGDQVFALAVTDLIQELYPHLRAAVGLCTIILLRLSLASHDNYTESEGSC